MKNILILTTLLFIFNCASNKNQECNSQEAIYATFESNQDTLDVNQDLILKVRMSNSFECLKMSDWKVVALDSKFYQSTSYEEKYPFSNNLETIVKFNQMDSLENDFAKIVIRKENLQKIIPHQYLFYVGKIKIENLSINKDSIFTVIVRL